MALKDLDPRLLRLTCASRAAPWVTRDDLRAIAAHGRARNPRARLTGVLLYGGGEFVMVTEGPGAAVERLWERIEADPRTIWDTRLARARALRRAFADWSMGCAGLEPAPGDAFFALDAQAPQVRPRVGGDFTVFLEQFFARSRGHRPARVE